MLASIKSLINFFVGLGVQFVIFIFIFALVKSFYGQPYTIPSGSMKPTLLIGDFIVVSKYQFGYSASSFPKPLAYLLPRGRVLASSKPKRGEIIVFRNEKDKHKEYIKRLIGLPGDHIQMVGGHLHVNGKATDKEYLKDVKGLCFDKKSDLPLYKETMDNKLFYTVIECSKDDGWADQTAQYVVPENHYFMMGDNRDESQDSRFINEVGYVPNDRIVGRANMVLFSIDIHGAKFWQVWKWYKFIRTDRFFKKLEKNNE